MFSAKHEALCWAADWPVSQSPTPRHFSHAQCNDYFWGCEVWNTCSRHCNARAVFFARSLTDDIVGVLSWDRFCSQPSQRTSKRERDPCSRSPHRYLDRWCVHSMRSLSLQTSEIWFSVTTLEETGIPSTKKKNERDLFSRRFINPVRFAKIWCLDALRLQSSIFDPKNCGSCSPKAKWRLGQFLAASAQELTLQ